MSGMLIVSGSDFIWGPRWFNQKNERTELASKDLMSFIVFHILFIDWVLYVFELYFRAGHHLFADSAVWPDCVNYSSLGMPWMSVADLKHTKCRQLDTSRLVQWFIGWIGGLSLHGLATGYSWSCRVVGYTVDGVLYVKSLASWLTWHSLLYQIFLESSGPAT